MILKARALTCGFFLLTTLPVQTAATARREPVAIVYQLTGEAQRVEPGRSREPVRLFDRLPAGTTLELAPGSRLALAFVTGKRYEIYGKARAALGKGDLGARSGGVRSLPSVPPLPRLAPIAEDDHPGPSAGAVRIRSERIEGLYPHCGTAVLAGETTLRFQLVTGAGKYRIEVRDRQDHVIFETETTDSVVHLPAEVLEPGLRYRWTVSTVERVGPVARGEADLVTLRQNTAEAREALRKSVEAAGDDDSLALLAGVDQSLGLLAEAREELRTALLKSPGDTALAEALAALERRLEEIP